MSVPQGDTSSVIRPGPTDPRKPAVSAQTSRRSTGAVPARRALSAKPSENPLRRVISAGKMPVLLEMHLTEADRIGYERMRGHYLRQGGELPRLIVLGQFVRELNVESPEVTREERELTGKLRAYADLVAAGSVDVVALNDGARGRDSLDNAIAAELLIGLGVDPTRLMANVVARNRMPDQIRSRLAHFADLGLRCALLLTGDLPVDQEKLATFPLDSVGMCDLARRMMIEGALPGDFLIAAAGHPNPDVDPDGLQALHKALAGAQVLITQAIYSVEMFRSWMEALRRNGVLEMVDVLAELIPITSSNQLRGVTRVPGMRIPESLIDELAGIEERTDCEAQSGGHAPDWVKEQRRRSCARITRDLLHGIRRVSGVSGFYLGCVHSFAPHIELLRETPLQPEHKGHPHRSAKLTGATRQRVLALRPAVDDLIDGFIRDIRRRQKGLVRRWFRRADQSGGVARALRVIESFKVPIFGCKHCDHCDLSVDALVCPRGCAKQMTHGSCGAPRLSDGKVLCEDTSRECTWAKIRSRRDDLGIEVATRLSIRPAPSPGFYKGERYSSFLPVLAGTQPGPDWRLLYQAPWAALMRTVRGRHRALPPETHIDLLTLVASKALEVGVLLEQDLHADRETILFKVLGLIGTPESRHLIETRLCELGLPAEGTVGELSIRELFQLADALPEIRARSYGSRTSGSSHAREVAFRALPEGAALHRAMRRELANGLIHHIAALGVPVTYAEVLLEARHVDDFLTALTMLKNELQLIKVQLGPNATPIAAHFDRVHYKHHYRAPISIQEVCESNKQTPKNLRLLIDLKQFGTPQTFRNNLREALEHIMQGKGESDGAIALEDFGPESKSVCWAFNAAFWQRLKDFEAATGISYDASIGGSTDHNRAYVRATARALHDRLCDNAPGGEALYILEIGVASTHRAHTFLDELRRLAELTGARYYDRIVYLLADYSRDILERGRNELALHHPRVEAVLIDAADPLATLTPYAGRIVHAHLCNVYDNLPTDRVAFAHGRLYHINVRCYVTRIALSDIGTRHNLDASELKELEDMLCTIERDRGKAVCALLDWLDNLCKNRGDAPYAYVHIWMEIIAALRFAERLSPILTDDDLDAHENLGLPHPVETIRKLAAPLGTAQIHLSQEAIRGFRSLVGLLHPAGALEVVDLFVQRAEEYLDRHKGPAKYDGSTVNWLNGPLFRLVGEAHNCDVHFYSFKPFDPKSVSVTMLAYPRQ